MSSSVESKPAARRRIAGERARTRPAPRPDSAPSTPFREKGAGLRERLHRVRGGAGAPAAPPAAVATTAVGQTRSGRGRWVAPLVALVVALAVLGTTLGVALRDPGTQARTDRAAASQARTSIEQLLSYSWKTVDQQSAQVSGLLTGSFKGEFTTAMDKSIKPLAVKNQTVVQAKVSDIGVMSSSPSTVKVLAFVNQAKVGSDQKEPVVDQNRVIATMTKVGDRWLVSKVEAF